MILNAIILILIISNFFKGFYVGFIRQLITLIGYILAIVVASMYYDKLAPYLNFIPHPNFDTTSNATAFLDALQNEAVYYNVLAFIIIFIAATIIVHMIASLSRGITNLPVLHQINGLLGAVLGAVTSYIYIFVLLYFAALFPIHWLMEAINDSSVAQWMMQNTPILSEQFVDWVTKVLTN